MNSMMGFMGKTPMQGKADGFRGNRAGHGGSRAAMIRSMMGRGAGAGGATPPQPPPMPLPSPLTDPDMPMPPMEPPILPGGPLPQFGGQAPAYVKPQAAGKPIPPPPIPPLMGSWY